MSVRNDPFDVLVIEQESDEFAALSRKPVATVPALPPASAAALARFHGFDLEDQPLVAGAPGLAYEILPARSTVPLRRSDIGSAVVVLFEGGDVRRPIVVGVIQDGRPAPDDPRPPAPQVTVQADDDTFVVSAEREITLRCGEASITLTRAGKVIIKGTYIVSRSSGYNKIKGAAVEIN